MIVTNKCRECRNKYELTWDDSPDDYFIGDDEDEIIDELSDPEYCPFCGTHVDFVE